MTDDKSRSRLACDFQFKDFWLHFKHIVEGNDLETPSWILTPRIVRQVVGVATSEGWKPFEKGRNFVVRDIEQKIDIVGTASVSEIRTIIDQEARLLNLRDPNSKIV